MVFPDPSVFLTQQLKPIVNQRNVGISAGNVVSLHMQESDRSRSGAQVDALTSSHHDTSAMEELSRLGHGASLSDANLYSSLVDQVNLSVAFGMEDHHHAPSGLSSSFGIGDIASPFPSIAPAQDCGRCIFSSPESYLGLVLTDDPTINYVPQASDEVSGYSVSSTLTPPPTSYTNNPNPQTSYVGQDTERNFRTAGSYAFPSVDIPSRYWGSGQPAAHSWAENPSFDLADPATWIDSSSSLGENIQVVDFESAQTLSDTLNLPSFGKQHIPFEGPVSHCEWKDENGAICGDMVTSASLPEHLSKHGIKKMTRNCPTKCNWVGCRRKKHMNRESIVRHIREVHLRLKRSPTKRDQEPHIQRHWFAAQTLVDPMPTS